MTDPIIMLDIEERLTQDADGSYKQQLERMLEEHIETIKKDLSAGMKPAEHQQQSLLQDALIASLRTVRLYWQSVHDTEALT